MSIAFPGELPVTNYYVTEPWYKQVLLWTAQFPTHVDVVLVQLIVVVATPPPPPRSRE
jgi:hypothetical protein